ncbi:MAG: hypothetical protein WAT23_14285 [Chromatiaceae bacterium]
MSRVFTNNLDSRLLAMLGMTLAAVLALVIHGPIPQSAAYHAFADQRSYWGIPNSIDTLSNLSFLLVGSAGLFALRRGVPAGALPALRPAYLVYFAGAALLFPTSGYYHLWPANETLLWDRLAMTVAFMAFLAIVMGEYIEPRLGIRLLVPLVALGMGSIAYWRLTDGGDGGDLRPYVLVQFLPMLLIPFIALTYRPLLRPVWYLWALLACYGLAKLFELLDEPILDLTQYVSGHSLKHLAAALGIGFFLLGLYQRRPEGRCVLDP